MMFFFLSFLMCLFLISFYNTYYLLILLYLEMLMLSVFFVLNVYFFSDFGFYGIFIFLLIMVCMGGYGISLLVSLFRECGDDFWVKSFIF